MERITLWCALVVTWAAEAQPATAQTGPPSTEELLEEIRQLRERVEALETEHRRVHLEDQKRIRDLEERLTELDRSRVEQGWTEEKAELRSELNRTQSSPGPFSLSGSGFGGGNLLNPEITVFVDTGGSISSKGDNKALNRFNLREAELDLRAAISPFADGVLILAFAEEIESQPNGDVDIGREVEIEEGYANFHTLPFDLSLKAGKFRSVFGRNNLLHTHDLPQVTRPLALRSFLGPEGLSSIGASVSWLVPNPWDKYVEVTAEVINADGGEEAPVLGGPNANNPAVVGHVRFFDDVTETSSFELGGSYLFAHTSRDNEFDANVFGLDATYQWIDPDPGTFRSLILQSELFWAHNDIDRGLFRSERNDSFGFYAFGQYQFHQDWYAGLRLDYTEFPNSESRGSGDWDFALSPYVSWYVTEFMRLRAEYQHRMLDINGDSDSEEAVFLQLTFVFGAHPPHPYWVNR